MEEGAEDESCGNIYLYACTFLQRASCNSICGMFISSWKLEQAFANGVQHHAPDECPFTFGQRYFIKCLNGLCAAQLTNKKKFAKSISLQGLHPGNKKKKNKEDRDKLCEHIHVVYNNLQSFKQFFPHYFNENENCIQLQPGIDAVNVDDANIAPPRGNFDQETGLWNFEGVTNINSQKCFILSLQLKKEIIL